MDGYLKTPEELESELEDWAKERERKKNKPESDGFQHFTDLSVFKLADKVSEEIWKEVSGWDYFAKKTIGDQIARSADSIGANIAEGFGRYHFGEYLVFLYYARGSLYETQYWLGKAKRRKLIDATRYETIKKELDKLPLELNTVIKIVKKESKNWHRGKRIR